jgi:hypothetical protein
LIIPIVFGPLDDGDELVEYRGTISFTIEHQARPLVPENKAVTTIRRKLKPFLAVGS